MGVRRLIDGGLIGAVGVGVGSCLLHDTRPILTKVSLVRSSKL